MEKQILKILMERIEASEDAIYGIPSSAQEITDHVFQFIDWLGENYICGHGIWIAKYTDQRVRSNWKCIEYLYKFWSDNVFSKTKKG